MSVNIMDSDSNREKKASLRKSNKPIMEKRRRARINSCLMQLKTLVLEAMRKDSSQYSKLEKADILEMTVKHLRNLQRSQMSTALASDPNVVTKYRAGFNECASEVLRYMNTAQCVNENVRSRLVGHLSSCLQNVNLPSQTPSQTPEQQQQQQQQQPTPVQQVQMQPLSVQIPQQHSNSNNNVQSVPSSTCLLMPGNVASNPVSNNTPNRSPTLVNITTPSRVENNTQITGSFQIVPGNVYNGPVAVYLGQVNESTQGSPTALPVFTLQVPAQQQVSSYSSPLMRNKENVINTPDSQDYCLKAKQSQLLGISCQKNNAYSDSLWRPW